MPGVAVIILNWNGVKLLKEYLPSVVKYTNPALARVVVVDNASSMLRQRWCGKSFRRLN